MPQDHKESISSDAGRGPAPDYGEGRARAQQHQQYSVAGSVGVEGDPGFGVVRPYVVNGDWEGMRSCRKTEKVPFDGYDELFPAHFTRTRCCFAMDSGECLLQRVATDHQLHPWKIKPRACWSFPIRGVAGDEILPPPTIDERDPDYVDENYPGYTSFLPCAKPDQENGIPWYEKYGNEVEYYRYLMRTGQLGDKF